ncbi:MAG: TIGR02206 family membrane protein [Cetobacterium sp.]
MENFTLFSSTHFYYLGGYFLFILFGLAFATFFNNKKKYAQIVALLILILKLSELYYRHTVFKEPIISLLPLHLCNLALIVALIATIFQIKFLNQIVYFWMPGAFFALITPEVKYSFPNIWNISFFLTHFYLFFVVFYEIIYFKFKATKEGLITSFLILNILALIIYFINSKLGTNYLYINYLPTFDSPLKYFGPWPYYILITEGIYLVLSFILYFPFRDKKLFKHY